VVLSLLLPEGEALRELKGVDLPHVLNQQSEHRMQAHLAQLLDQGIVVASQTPIVLLLPEEECFCLNQGGSSV